MQRQYTGLLLRLAAKPSEIRRQKQPQRSAQMGAISRKDRPLCFHLASRDRLRIPGPIRNLLYNLRLPLTRCTQRTRRKIHITLEPQKSRHRLHSRFTQKYIIKTNPPLARKTSRQSYYPTKHLKPSKKTQNTF
jgi:hypothetical protein